VSDRIFGTLICLLALAYIASATQIQTSFLTDPVGPKLFPIIVASIAFICGVAVIINPDESPSWPAPSIWISLFVATVALIAFAYALKPLGFIIPAAVVSAIISYLIHRNFMTAILTGIGLSVVLYFVFKQLLGLSLAAFSKNLIGQ